MSNHNHIALDDLESVLTRQTLLPTIVMWNRLEGRPRRKDFDRALRAEIRDALWMLTRQWQMGELRGDDAGSPVVARLLTRRSPLTAFQPNGRAVRPLDPDVPLEATVEARPVPFETRQQKLSLDLRLVMGRQWLKMVAPLGDFRTAYVNRYRIERPDPRLREDAPLCAHVDVWQHVNALAGRAMDGAALYGYLTGGADRHAHDGISMSTTAQGHIDAAAGRFIAWCDRLFVQPPEGEDAWDPGQLEYRFSVEAAGDPAGSVLKAEEYSHGRLDWYNLDLDASAGSLSASEGPPFEDVPHVLLPTALRFAGMPNTRWWSFEDGSTNFGDVAPDTHELAKLLMMEFALVYGNDWFLVPLGAPVGSLVTVRGLAVSNVFGERTWIAASGQGRDEAWQAWRMFNPSIKGQEPTAAAGSLLLLATTAKGQEGQPFEDVALIRDEVANMVWGIETVVPLATGASKRGREAALELRAHIERIVQSASLSSEQPAFRAPVRYEIMNTVPEHWIPFIPVHRQDSNRQIQLQRASLPRIIEGDTVDPPEKVKPRTILLRQGLDDEDSAKAYFLHEEEVPRTGVRVYQAFQRARWFRGRVCTWLGVRKMTGRGEGASGLAFDQVRATSQSRPI